MLNPLRAISVFAYVGPIGLTLVGILNACSDEPPPSPEPAEPEVDLLPEGEAELYEVLSIECENGATPMPGSEVEVIIVGTTEAGEPYWRWLGPSWRGDTYFDSEKHFAYRLQTCETCQGCSYYDFPAECSADCSMDFDSSSMQCAWFGDSCKLELAHLPNSCFLWSEDDHHEPQIVRNVELEGDGTGVLFYDEHKVGLSHLSKGLYEAVQDGEATNHVHEGIVGWHTHDWGSADCTKVLTE